MLIALPLGLVIGVAMGVTGAGGGVLTVPALVLLLELPMQQAAAVALVSMVLAGGVGSVEGLRAGLVRYRAALLMALASLPCSTLGIQLAQALPQTWLMRGFSLVMLLSALRSLLARPGTTPDSEPLGGLRALGPIHPDSGRFIWSARSASLLAAIGALAGFMAGLLGVGGGFVIVPMLRRFTQLGIHAAVATALAIITLISLGGASGMLLHGMSPPPGLTALFAGGAVLGVLLGRRLARKMSPRQVQRAFALLLLGVAGWLGAHSLR